MSITAISHTAPSKNAAVPPLVGLGDIGGRGIDPERIRDLAARARAMSSPEMSTPTTCAPRQRRAKPTVSARHIQHPVPVDRRRKDVADTVGDEPVAVTNPGGIPVGDLVVPRVPGHEPLLARLAAHACRDSLNAL